MKLNFNFDIKDFDGTVYGNAANILSNQLKAANETTDPVKLYGWAQKLYEGKELELDKSDQKKLYDFIKEHQSLFVIAKGQLLEVFDKN